MQFLLLFLEGIITFISPCLLPLLPVYISFFAAGQSGKRRTLANSVGFVSGFTFVFILLGAFAGTFGRLFIEYATAINIASGLVIIVLGLNFMGLINIRVLNQTIRKTADVKDLKFFSSLLFGMVFAAGWTPCVGAFLGSALMMAAAQGNTFDGIIMLFVYSAGLGIPFVISAVLIDQLKDAFDFIKRNYKLINIISGTFLIVLGILTATGLMGRYFSLMLP